MTNPKLPGHHRSTQIESGTAGAYQEHQRHELYREQSRHLGENVRLHGGGGAVQEALKVGRPPLLHPLPTHGPSSSPPVSTQLCPLQSPNHPLHRPQQSNHSEQRTAPKKPNRQEESIRPKNLLHFTQLRKNQDYASATAKIEEGEWEEEEEGREETIFGLRRRSRGV